MQYPELDTYLPAAFLQELRVFTALSSLAAIVAN